MCLARYKHTFIFVLFFCRFIKVLNRGEHNSCSRCDLIFKPVKPREERDRERKTHSVSSTPSKEEPKVGL